MSAAKPAPADWLPKRAAAEFLGISNRQLERRAYEGYVSKKFLERLPKDRSQTVVYKRADLEALKAGAPNMRAVVSKPKPAKPRPAISQISDIQLSEPGGQLQRTAAAPADPFAGLAAHLARLGAAFPPPAPAKPWLTLAEASAFSGLPAAWLLKEARDGAAFATNCGSAKRAAWRFSRERLAK